MFVNKGYNFIYFLEKTEEELTNTVRDVVFPKKPYGEIELEYELGLNLYRRTHNHYLPGQKRDHL